MEKKTKINNSETRIVRRSQIGFNPINPKRHTPEAVKIQKRNLKKVGFLGGLVWNETTGHLIDGHRRLQAMDSINGYDGTGATDYEVKVEAVSLDEKTEKEQITYMAAGVTKYDLDMVASYIGEIDYSNIGLPDNDLSDILAIAGIGVGEINIDDPFAHLITPAEADAIAEENKISVEEADDILQDLADTLVAGDKEARTEHVKNVKQKVKEIADKRADYAEATITLSFSTLEAKRDFCDIIGISSDARYAKGEMVLSMIN